METYLRAFVNYEQNDWGRFLLMAEFAYNSVQNTSTGHTPFKLNFGYHLHISYKENIDSCSKSKIVDELSTKL